MRFSRGGFTLIEMMVVVAIAAILAAVVMPSYAEYVRRSHITEAQTELADFSIRMEQLFQDNMNYGVDAACSFSPPASEYFIFSCELTDGGRGFMAEATGFGSLAGYKFTIDDTALRQTVSFPNASGLPLDCWLTQPGSCT